MKQIPNDALLGSTKGLYVYFLSHVCIQSTFQPGCTLKKSIIVMFTSHHNCFVWEEDEPNPQRITTNNLPCNKS